MITSARMDYSFGEGQLIFDKCANFPTFIMRIISSIWLLFFINIWLNESLYCHDAYSCALKPVVSNVTNIQCWGYFSCSESPTITSNHHRIECYGSFSCYKANLIEHSGSQFSAIHCLLIFIVILHCVNIHIYMMLLI